MSGTGRPAERQQWVEPFLSQLLFLDPRCFPPRSSGHWKRHSWLYKQRLSKANEMEKKVRKNSFAEKKKRLEVDHIVLFSWNDHKPWASYPSTPSKICFQFLLPKENSLIKSPLPPISSSLASWGIPQYNSLLLKYLMHGLRAPTGWALALSLLPSQTPKLRFPPSIYLGS